MYIYCIVLLSYHLTLIHISTLSIDDNLKNKQKFVNQLSKHVMKISKSIPMYRISCYKQKKHLVCF